MSAQLGVHDVEDHRLHPVAMPGLVCQLPYLTLFQPFARNAWAHQSQAARWVPMSSAAQAARSSAQAADSRRRQGGTAPLRELGPRLHHRGRHRAGSGAVLRTVKVVAEALGMADGGVKVHVHQLRQAYATDLLEDGDR